jgi:RimJ/RimL family protein N-acetyltransferase
MTDPHTPTVREMTLSEVDLRIDYFHNATDDHLRVLGVDRALLPSRDSWQAFYEADYARPIAERLNYTLAWELAGRIVGFSSTDNITFGEQAFMHLHIIESGDRRVGMGTEFVRLSAVQYFRVLTLQRLYCQPNAFNVAPNRTLQRAGFRYEFTREMQPSPINFPQPITRWILDKSPTPSIRSEADRRAESDRPV